MKPRRFLAIARDASITIGQGEDDPTVAGAALRLVSAAGDGFDVSYELPAAGWRRIGSATSPKGYRYGGAGAVRRVVLRAGKLARIVGIGSQLGYTLGSAPDPTAVVLDVGTRRYCMSFGGATSFRAAKKFVAHDAPAPAACPTPAEARIGTDVNAEAALLVCDAR